MLQPPPPFSLRPLRLSDLEAMLAIERASFPTPAREQIYKYDLAQNELAHYQALEVGGNGRSAPQLIGYAGYWLMGDEVHISTIAVDPPWRGRGLGELLLLNLLYLACGHKASMVTLEVRRSNEVAQALYRKYGFELVGERKRYYHDPNRNTREDALLMTAQLTDAPDYRAQLDHLRTILFRRLRSAHF